MRHLAVTTALAAILAAAPALAQQQNQQPQQQQVQQQSQQAPQQARQQAGGLQFATAQGPRDWSSEALTGRNVENPQGENLGSIKNVIIDEDGDVKAVIIGVGGFLGIGQKDVGVPFSALEFSVRTEDRAAGRVAGPAPRQTAQQGQPAPMAQRPDRDGLAPGQERTQHFQLVDEAGQVRGQVVVQLDQVAPQDRQARQRQDQPAGQQARQPQGQQRMTVQDDRAARYDSEHRNVRIVLNTTRDLLRDAPEFKWLDDQSGDAWTRGGRDAQPVQQRAPDQPQQQRPRQ